KEPKQLCKLGRVVTCRSDCVPSEEAKDENRHALHDSIHHHYKNFVDAVGQEHQWPGYFFGEHDKHHPKKHSEKNDLQHFHVRQGLEYVSRHHIYHRLQGTCFLCLLRFLQFVRHPFIGFFPGVTFV